MATPPIRAVEAVRNTGLSDIDNGEGWLPTDHQTLQVYGQQGVYVIGDTVDLPVSKAGGSCHNQAPVIADNIVAELRLGQPTPITTARCRPSPKWGYRPVCRWFTTIAMT
ncbi:Uncharacterised protein [Serratia fonticola]|uniref:Dihydrolipoyl dehydrogenase n=1 Tax=Serratia fonticola TaxID=47917 RepID=A0A4U9WGS8_SERFO|nr:Uncharacterised protein [Serratia fonticola]